MTNTYSSIKEHLNIKVDKHLNDGFAHLTHFWQNCYPKQFHLRIHHF